MSKETKVADIPPTPPKIIDMLVYLFSILKGKPTSGFHKAI